ncbi:MAG TPA: FAD-dependent monooxygenase [Allosphingosinicella sp.]|jgi:flavin-dependent dehydrogenase
MRFDVVVAGAGPAGLVAATLLARGGALVAVARAPPDRPPRPGETLPGAGLRLLRRLELPVPAEAGGHRRLTGIASAWDGELIETDYLGSPDGPAWLLDRAAFDGALAAAAAAAGVRFVERRASAQRQDAGWRLGEEISAGFLVDATGRSAALARRLGARTRIEHDLVALWAVAEGEAPPRLERPLIERTGDGWWYAVRLCERRTYAAFHVPAASSAKARAPEGWAQGLRATRFLAPLVAEAGAFPPPRGSPAGGSRLGPCRGDGWAACGDAALAFDPLSSQGLLGAMAGGHMLAEALLAEDRERALADYETRLQEIGRLYGDRRAAFYG